MGTELAVRRGTGIIGRLSVSNIADGNVFADPLPGTFPSGNIDVKVGDELIIPSSIGLPRELKRSFCKISLLT